MGKVSEAEREAIRQAAEAVLPLVRRLLQDRAEIDEKLARYQPIVQDWEQLSGQRRSEGSSSSGRRTRRGEVAGYISAVLGDGGKFGEQEIRNRIKEKFAVDVPRGTVYSTLTRGRKAGKYEHAAEKWSIKGA
jgi:hypothetical protein